MFFSMCQPRKSLRRPLFSLRTSPAEELLERSYLNTRLTGSEEMPEAARPSTKTFQHEDLSAWKPAG